MAQTPRRKSHTSALCGLGSPLGREDVCEAIGSHCALYWKVPFTHCVAESRPFNLSFLLSKIGTKNIHFIGLLRRFHV